MTATLTTAVETVAAHWRWITAATAVSALLTSAASYYWLPTLYRSESMIRILKPPHAAYELERYLDVGAMTTAVLSDARLDPIVKDFGLDDAEQVRRSIRVTTAAGDSDTTDATSSFTIGFQSRDPRLSQKVTERLTTLFIIENFEDQARAGRAIGEQFRVTKPASLPKAALRPGMTTVTASGAVAGLALSIVALTRRKPPALP